VGEEQTVRVIVERRRRRSGVGKALLAILVVAFAVHYWYVSLALLGTAALSGLLVRSRGSKRRGIAASGPQDPWLNEVAVALAELDLSEVARNTGAQLGGAPVEGDIGLSDQRMTIYANLFASDALARQAEMGLRAQPQVRQSSANGRTAIVADGRILYVASAKSGVVDEFRLEEVRRAVDQIALPPALANQSAARARPLGAAAAPALAEAHQQPAVAPDALEQLHRLGELRERGLLTEEEFAAKKAELLRRI